MHYKLDTQWPLGVRGVALEASMFPRARVIEPMKPRCDEDVSRNVSEPVSAS